MLRLSQSSSLNSNPHHADCNQRQEESRKSAWLDPPLLLHHPCAFGQEDPTAVTDIASSLFRLAVVLVRKRVNCQLNDNFADPTTAGLVRRGQHQCLPTIGAFFHRLYTHLSLTVPVNRRNFGVNWRNGNLGW
jgi:hypothetical protein